MRILLADDHDLIRDALSAYLRNEGGAEVVCVSDLQSALKKVVEGPAYDLVVLDYNMPGMNGLLGISSFCDAFPETPVALLSGSATNTVAQEAIELGAMGFLPKTLAGKSLVNAIRFMLAGEVFVPRSAIGEDQGLHHPLAKDLSKREREVLSGLCRGLSNRQIAEELQLQEVTIKLHVRTLCRKIDARNRTHAAMLAKEAGIF